MIKKTEQRYKELADMGINVRIICVGRKGSAYFKRRPQYNVEGEARGWPPGTACLPCADHLQPGWGLSCLACGPAQPAGKPCESLTASLRRAWPLRRAANFEVGQSPTIKEAQAIADDIFSDFVSQAGRPPLPLVCCRCRSVLLDTGFNRDLPGQP